MMTSTMSAERRNSPLRALGRGAAVAAFDLLLWEAAARAVAQPLLLPTPAEVFARLFSLLPQGAFWLTLLGTLGRTLLSYVLGVAFAVLLGALCCRYRLADLLISPMLSAVRATPVTSFIVLALVWLSSSRGARAHGLSDDAPRRVLRADPGRAGDRPPPAGGGARVWLREGGHAAACRRPAVLPAVVENCLAAIGLCWKAVVAAEVIGVPKLAVGSRLYEAKIYLETDSLLAWTLTIVLLSVLLEKLLRAAAARVMEVRHG